MKSGYNGKFDIENAFPYAGSIYLEGFVSEDGNIHMITENGLFMITENGLRMITEDS